jgi:type II secretory pathway component PulL
MNQLATTLGRAGPGVTLRTLSYDGANGTLRLVVEAPDMNSLQRVQPALAAGGLEVLTDAATFDPTSNIAGFRIETGDAGAIR